MRDNKNMDLTCDEFDRLVQEAIDLLDPSFRKYLDEVPVIVEDHPDPQILTRLKMPSQHQLLGLFQGIPLYQRRQGHAYTCQITLFRENLLARAHTPSTLLNAIRRTLIHELGHFLGFSESQLRAYDF